MNTENMNRPLFYVEPIPVFTYPGQWDEFFDPEHTKCPVCGAIDWIQWKNWDRLDPLSVMCHKCKAKFNSVDEFLDACKPDQKNEDRETKHKTVFRYIGVDWKRVKNHCRTTVNKAFTENEPTEEFKKKLLISEHSPIRLIEIDWSWHDIKSWVSVHWTRHKHEKFVSTQRDDRKEHDISRDDMPQGTLVDMDNYANMQQLIDIFRKRLCHQASPETRELAEDFKLALHEEYPELANILVPNCIYRCGCPEFKMCKERHFLNFLEYCNDNNIHLEHFSANIQKRYDTYNQWFYDSHKKSGDDE